MRTLKWCGALALMFSLHTLNAQSGSYSGTGTYHPWEIGFRYMPTFSSFDVRSSSGVVSGKFSYGTGWEGASDTTSMNMLECR